MNSATTLEERERTDTPQEPPDSSASSFAAIIAAVFVGSFSLILYLNWHFRFDLSDDAYIHMRIAHNLLRTGHPYFNPGERVMVTSSPVWTLLLSLTAWQRRLPVGLLGHGSSLAAPRIRSWPYCCR
jgi:hypothetical protein